MEQQMTNNRREHRIRMEEILDLGEYERQRDAIRPLAMAARALRRIAVGPNATLAFENRETVRYQIHEMLRTERIAKPEDVEHEIDTYSDLLPTPMELSATLLVEFPDPEERNARLRELVGFEDHFRLEIDGTPAPADFDRRQIESDKISSVQFVRFPLDDHQRSAILEERPVSIVSDHPGYRQTAALSEEQIRALAEDLRTAESS